MLGTYALSSGYKDAYYLKALKVRRLIKNDFDDAFAKCDVVDGPDDADGRRSRSARRPTTRWRCTCPTSTRSSCNLAASPGLSIPCGFTKAGLPIGLQLLAPPFEEEKLLRIARMYEAATDWHTRRPKVASPGTRDKSHDEDIIVRLTSRHSPLPLLNLQRLKERLDSRRLR